MKITLRRLIACALVCMGFVSVASTLSQAAEEKPLRPPSVPLIACDPYFSVWSPADRLTDTWPTHWTGHRQQLSGLVRIDGSTYRIMGTDPAGTPAMKQVGLDVLPTRTIYQFATDEIALSLTFFTPALPDDLDVISRPVTYVTWEAKAKDGKSHDVSVYFDASAELAVNVADQSVEWSRPQVAGLSVLRIGSVDQPVLAKKGDNLRIDWGYAYVAAPQDAQAQYAVASAATARGAFAAGQRLSATDDARMPRAAKEDLPVMAFALDMGKVGDAPVTRYVIAAYDDLYSIKYMGQKLRPYWRRNGAEAADLLKTSARDYAALLQRAKAFDAEIMQDLTAAGGEKYARIGALAYRECLAGNKIAADAAGLPIIFPKENFSNGCIATVDIIYPMAPQFLLFSPALAKASMVNIMDYSNSPRWRFPFAPHDLGTYPMANGQVYGGGERTVDNQMPVEESGNMLLLLGAIAKIEGNADFANRYWPVLTRWAEYLKTKGFDPENQLCTDDFAGHLAHNVNLSAKAILGLASYAMLCDMTGRKDEAAAYRKTAEEYAAKWVQMAAEGDHYRLAFDRPNTWSQKYNLIWDRVLGLKVFPKDVCEKEMNFYRKSLQRYGLPLDNRKTYTKLDWITWTASLTGSKEDFETLVAPIYEMLNDSTSRVPMTDWYETTNARQVGFQARPVVGGVFIRLLDNPGIWKKWADRGGKVSNNWAPLPTPPQRNIIVPTSSSRPVSWRYVVAKPADDWFKAEFDDSAWKAAPGGFGTAQTPGAVVRTEWNTADIWLRREFTLPEGTLKNPMLSIHHDEDAEVYINDVPAARVRGFSTSYEEADIAAAARASLKPGKNVMAVHCHQTTGGQYIDVGIVGEK